MAGLYTRQVTSARLHILTLLVSFYHDINYISFITLFLILIILLSFISVYHVVIAYIFLCTSTFSLHTHSLGHFWRSWIRTFGTLDIFLYCSGVRVIVRFARSWSFSRLVLVLFSLVFLLFLDSRYTSDSVFIPIFLYDIMCECLYMILQWSLIYYGLDL